jgi:hypothetical protein
MWSSRGELRRSPSKRGAWWRTVWLALNGCYSPPQYAYLMELARVWASWGGSGVILRDLAFLRLLKTMSLPLRFSLSLLAVAANSAAARFFRVQGVDRIVLRAFCLRRIWAVSPPPRRNWSMKPWSLTTAARW